MNQLVEELYSKLDNQERIIRGLQQRVNQLERERGNKSVKVTIYLSTGIIEFASKKTLHEIIDDIQAEYPDNIGFKIINDEPKLILKKER